MLDLSNPALAAKERRLREDPMIWLTSVRPDGRPHLVAVWFLWDGTHIIIFSKPNNQKIRNIRQNPNVTLGLDDTKRGADVVTIEGIAELVDDPTLAATLPAYAAKYQGLMARLGMDAAQMAAIYSQAIRITPTRLP